MKSPFERMHYVAKEMQHLLWKPTRAVTDLYRGWWNCAEHSVMTGALMWINGCDVEIRVGEAFFAQGPKESGATPCLQHVVKHWWITAKDIGLVDFSPDLSVAAPDWDACDFDYVFGNKVFAPMTWGFEHTGRIETVNAKLKSVNHKVGGYACIYFRNNSKSFDPNLFLGAPLISNQGNEPWAQAALLYHLQKVLENDRESLRGLPMEAAWNELRALPESEVSTVTAKLMR